MWWKKERNVLLHIQITCIDHILWYLVKTSLETQCLNFLADSSLLDYIREWKPFSLMNMVWSVHDFLFSLVLASHPTTRLREIFSSSLTWAKIACLVLATSIPLNHILFHQHKLLIQESIHCYCTPFQWKLLYCYFLKSIFVIKIHFWLLHRMAKEQLKLWSPNTIYL